MSTGFSDVQEIAGAVVNSNVSSSATNVTLLAANERRKGVTIFNDSTSAVDVKYGATATASSFTVEIAAGGYWEMPKPIYRGVIDAIWDASNGAARISELTD